MTNIRLSEEVKQEGGRSMIINYRNLCFRNFLTPSSLRTLRIFGVCFVPMGLYVYISMNKMGSTWLLSLLCAILGPSIFLNLLGLIYKAFIERMTIFNQKSTDKDKLPSLKEEYLSHAKTTNEHLPTFTKKWELILDNMLKSGADYFFDMSFLNMDLKSKCFEYCYFHHCRFDKTDLSKSTFKNCVFDDCRFTNGSLVDTVFTDTTFRALVFPIFELFWGTELTGVTFKNVTIEDEVFAGMYLVGAPILNEPTVAEHISSKFRYELTWFESLKNKGTGLVTVGDIHSIKYLGYYCWQVTKNEK